jgi:hypothetical protein
MTATWDFNADRLTAAEISVADDERVAGDGIDPMLVERGLRSYVHRVATGLGLGAAATYCEMAEQPSAYIALDDRVAGRPDQDSALIWDLDHGWALAVETHSGEDLLVVAYHGLPLLPPPPDVIAFTEAALIRPPTTPGPPPARPRATDQLAGELLAYLPSRRPGR